MSRATFFVLLPFTACQPPAASTRAEAPAHAQTANDPPGTSAAPRSTPQPGEFESARESMRTLGGLEATDPEVLRLEQLEHARELFQAFIERANARPDLAEPLARAAERIADIDAEIAFVREGLAERRLNEVSAPPSDTSGQAR